MVAWFLPLIFAFTTLGVSILFPGVEFSLGMEKVFDPIVTPLLFIRAKKFGPPRVIENFFSFPGSQSWGCVIWYENREY